MISNEERYGVVARLRKNEPSSFDSLFDVWREIALAVNPSGGNYKTLPLELADLIEPEPERTCKMKVSPGTAWRRCSFCGAFVYSDAVTNATSVIQVRYCPNCGTKVVEVV